MIGDVARVSLSVCRLSVLDRSVGPLSFFWVPASGTVVSAADRRLLVTPLEIRAFQRDNRFDQGIFWTTSWAVTLPDETLPCIWT